LRTGWRGWLKVALVVAPAGALVALGLSWRPALAPIRPPSSGSFAPQQVARGAVLAKLGDCAVCHTREGGRPLAGGRALPTPFGTLYSTNLTPIRKPASAPGRPRPRRAMKDGVRGMCPPYPALPYEHFTHVSDADLDALYAYLMTRPAVRARRRKPPDLPLGFRPLLAGGNVVSPRRGNAEQSAPERGMEPRRHLAEGLAIAAPATRRATWPGAKSARGPMAGPCRRLACSATRRQQSGGAALDTERAVHIPANGHLLDHSAAGGPMGPVVESLPRRKATNGR
jgi:mono/diheme cytochrome c family protein